MSTVIEESATRTETTPSQRLRFTTAAVRLAFTWLGTRKTLTIEQKNQAAESFGAEGQYLSAGKKLLDTKHPAFKAVSSVRSRIVSYWKGLSLPYPDTGIRLIRQDQIENFNQHMNQLRDELQEAVWRLDEHYAELEHAARDRLGSLYNAADYPDSLRGLFQVSWDFPSVEPPDYLQQVNPEIYQQECQRVAARFDEAVQLAEQAFIEELGKLVTHVTERLTGSDDGKPKIFRDSAMENLQEFFERFRQLNIGSSEQLDQLVSQVQSIVRGVQPQELRDSRSLRQHVVTELSAAQSVLDGLLVDRPRRNILRRPR